MRSAKLGSKSNGKWRRIHHLSYPRAHSVNCHISNIRGILEYTTFDKAKQEVIQAGPVGAEGESVSILK